METTIDAPVAPQSSTYRPLLAGLALVHLALVPIELLLLALDPRRLDGGSVWLKPLRFDVSIAIFLVTMLCVLSALAHEEAARFAKRIAAAMIIETLCIALQAARGVHSHFNIGSAFDGAVYDVMGLAIIYNSYVLARVLIAFVRGRDHLHPVMHRAVVLGLSATLLGSVIGGMMAARMTHAGMRGGDMRVAHFIGLHGLQLLLLAGLTLTRMSWSNEAKRRVLDVVFVCHLALTTVALLGA